MGQNNSTPSSSSTKANDAATASNWVPVANKSVFTPRKLRVACVGAGYAGLMIAYKYKYEYHMDDYVDLAIYDKNADVGGTWFENRYPGLACDVPAHIYTFPFEPNPDWSALFASGPEIWQYIRRTTTKYHLDEHVHFNSTVTSTIWDDSIGRWQVKIQSPDGTMMEDTADILINGSGILNRWRWPDISGLHSFKGDLVHSASWDPDLDWTGKRVAIIGNGSSAIQILPQVQRTAKHIVTYIRSPTWISPSLAAQLTPSDGHNVTYTEEEKKRLRENSDELRTLRKTLEHGINQFFGSVVLNSSPQQAAAQAAFSAEMKKRLGDKNEHLHEKLIPKWTVGCRRLTPGAGYLEALQASNVTIEMSPIQKITDKGIASEASMEEFDIIVCATGFDVSFSPFWELVGKDGIRLADQWRESPEAYFGVCAPNMPNYFIFNGPNCPIGHGSVLSPMNWMADYILRWCRKIATEDIRSVQVSSDATHDYNVYTQEFMKGTAWSSGCRSWYKNGKIDGRVTAMYAGSVVHYKEMLESFRTEDFNIEYRSNNRFRFMGNGLTIRERNEEDLAYYIQ